MARAIRRAMGHSGFATQTQLAEATGLSASQISNFLKGKAEPHLPKIALIEKACGLPRGWVLRQAGYVEDDPTDPTPSAQGLHGAAPTRSPSAEEV